jgi:hypothetical protein
MACPERQAIATHSPTRRGTPQKKKKEKRKGVMKRLKQPHNALFEQKIAESKRFELLIHFWRIRTFQARSLNHSDNSPDLRPQN